MGTCNMDARQSQSRRDPTAQPRAGGPVPDRQGCSHKPEEYTVLLRQYGEVMLKIGQMEARIDSLQRQLEAGLLLQDPGRLPQTTTADAPAYTRESDEIPQPSHPAEQGTDRETPRYENELRKMRLQISTLANQLAQSKDELARLQSHRSHLRRRTERRSLWRRLSRRFGVGGMD